MIRNLTPHPIQVYPFDPEASDLRLVHEGPERTLPVDGPPVRLAMNERGTESGDDLPFAVVEYGDAHDLPPKADGVQLVVSLPVALSLVPQGRDDLLVPYMEVRDERGTIAGCRMLARPVLTLPCSWPSTPSGAGAPDTEKEAR